MVMMIIALDEFKEKTDIMVERAEQRNIAVSKRSILGKDGKIFHMFHLRAQEDVLKKFVDDSHDVLKKYDEKTIVVA